MNRIKTAALTLSALVLSACATNTVSDDFLCDAQLGSPCTTIADADGSQGRGVPTRRAPHTGGGPRTQPPPDHGLSHREGRDIGHDVGVHKGPQPIAFDNGGDLQRPPAVVSAGPSLFNSQVLNPVLFRAPERVSSIWIAPFVGENGFLYQPGYVHFVVEEGRWFGPSGEEVAVQ
jgi:conjugal transfer pilus assembly protein TraV